MRLARSLITAIVLFFSMTSIAFADPLVVNIDQNARLTLPSAARDVMVGNPGIADVAVIDGRNILILGRAYGTTSLMVTNAAGRVILNTQIVVAANDRGRVSVYRGPQVQTYACASRCETAPLIGAAPMASSAPAAAP
jgi:Flp pilus assembly secretin CpaC